MPRPPRLQEDVGRPRKGAGLAGRTGQRVVDLDKERLVKLLNLTGSAHDGEALAAIRKANELLDQHKASWSDVMGIGVEPASAPEPEPAPPPPPPPHPWPQARPRPPVRPRPSVWAEAAAAVRRRTEEVPTGYALARHYRNAFRREPFVPRLLAFPFWIVVELLGLILPRMVLNTGSAKLVITFVMSLVVGSFAWIALGYYIFVEMRI